MSWLTDWGPLAEACLYFGVASTLDCCDNKKTVLDNKKVVSVTGSTERLNITKIEKH